MPRTKIVCTIGPSSRPPEALARLVAAGMDVARLNFSHGTHAEHAAVIATLGTVLAALYILLMYQRTMTGPKPTFAEGESPRDLSVREKVVVVPIIASFLLLGFFPKPVLDILNPAVDRTLVYVGVTDPTPTNASGSTK